jgi:uncharacterized protein YaaQ
MRLIIAILRDEDSDPVSQSLVSHGFRVTKTASTGGFLRRGSTTLMIGVEDDKVDEAIQIVQECLSPPIEPSLKRATLFVIKVDRFIQL